MKNREETHKSGRGNKELVDKSLNKINEIKSDINVLTSEIFVLNGVLHSSKDQDSIKLSLHVKVSETIETRDVVLKDWNREELDPHLEAIIRKSLEEKTKKVDKLRKELSDEWKILTVLVSDIGDWTEIKDRIK